MSNFTFFNFQIKTFFSFIFFLAVFGKNYQIKKALLKRKQKKKDKFSSKNVTTKYLAFCVEKKVSQRTYKKKLLQKEQIVTNSYEKNANNFLSEKISQLKIKLKTTMTKIREIQINNY